MIKLECLSDLNTKTHPCFNTKSEVKKLLDTLNNIFKIDVFIYSKSFNDRSIIGLTSYPEYSEAYIKQKIYSNDWGRFASNCYTKARKIHSLTEGNHLMTDLMQSFSVCESVSFINPVADGCEFFYFEITEHTDVGISTIINEINTLERFVNNFSLYSASLIKKLLPHKVIALDFAHEITSGYLRQKSVSYGEFLSQIYNCKITALQINIVKLISQGWKAKEIATIHKLSHRSVEQIIYRLKCSTNSTSVAQLIKKILP